MHVSSIGGIAAGEYQTNERATDSFMNDGNDKSRSESESKVTRWFNHKGTRRIQQNPNSPSAPPRRTDDPLTRWSSALSPLATQVDGREEQSTAAMLLTSCTPPGQMGPNQRGGPRPADLHATAPVQGTRASIASHAEGLVQATENLPQSTGQKARGLLSSSSGNLLDRSTGGERGGTHRLHDPDRQSVGLAERAEDLRLLAPRREHHMRSLQHDLPQDRWRFRSHIRPRRLPVHNMDVPPLSQRADRKERGSRREGRALPAAGASAPRGSCKRQGWCYWRIGRGKLQNRPSGDAGQR